MSKEEQILQLLLIRDEVLETLDSEGFDPEDPLEVKKLFVKLDYDTKIMSLTLQIFKDSQQPTL